MNSPVTIRFAALKDAAELAEIYAPYVRETAVTFEYEAPSAEAFAQRMEAIQRRYPFIAAVCGNEIAGYAYANKFVGRAAYDWAVETSIYVRRGRKKQGVGKLLYGELEALLREMHVCNLNACIACPETEDEYLTRNSVDFHAHLGYAMVGEFHKCGYKFGRWYNMAWMEKHIAPHPDAPLPLVSVNDLGPDILNRFGEEHRP